LVRYHHFHAKLLRLIIGARHQSHSRNLGHHRPNNARATIWALAHAGRQS
jgi:hypothetical protein